MQPIDIGSRLELFVDEYLIAEMDGVERRLNRPEPQEVVLEHDEPWEGKLSGHYSIFEDGDTYRMYYECCGVEADRHSRTGYAESEDGIRWEKPDLGLHEFDGSTQNNIVADLEASGNLAVWKDENPDCDPKAAYKAQGAIEMGKLAGYESADGFDWSPIEGNPFLTEGAFDTHNTAFWDPVREEYRSYTREFDESGEGRRRIIQTAMSNDFRTWTEPVPLEYPDAPEEQLYTNSIKPYYRAPHIFLGFPMRYVERDETSRSMQELPGWDLRKKLIEERGRQGYALTDILFMSSRNGRTFERWPKAFIRPGLWKKESTANWFYGSTSPGWQLVETASPTTEKPRELSLYVSECYRGGPDVADPDDRGVARLRRYSLRIDGFVSLEAPLDGGEFLTKPVTFEGDELVLNYTTSAAGAVRVELQHPDGTPYDGFSLSESPELFGDDLDRTVTWSDDRSAGELAGEPVRLRFAMSDADVYSFRFRPAP